MKKVATLFAVVLLLVALTGCGGSGAGLPVTGDYYVGNDLVSHSGSRLARDGVHRFTWTPAAPAGATWSRLYIDLLMGDSTGEDTKTSPADVKILNFDKEKMGVLESTMSYADDTKETRIAVVNAVPGTVVELEIRVVPWRTAYPPSYNRLQFGRVDNIYPPNYRVAGRLLLTG